MFFPFFSSFFFNIYFLKKYFHFYFVFLLSCVCPILFYYFLNHFYQFVLFPCFILQLAHCVGFVFRLCVFVSLNPNCLISFLTSSICLVDLLLFLLFGSIFVSFTCVCISLFLFCLILFLPFLWGFVCLFFKYIFYLFSFFFSISMLFFCYSVFYPLSLFLFFLNHFCQFVLFLCFILQLALCLGFVFGFCVFVSFLFNCLISFLSSFVYLVVLSLFDLLGSVFVSFVCVRVSLFLFLSVWFYFLPFVWGFIRDRKSVV